MGLEIAIDIVTNSYYFLTSLLQLRKDKEGKVKVERRKRLRGKRNGNRDSFYFLTTFLPSLTPLLLSFYPH